MRRGQGHVFISYAHEDLAYVAELVDFLIQQGLTVWWDRRIPTGRLWDDALKEMVETAGAVVVVMTEHARRSHWVAEEIHHANLHHRPIYPIALDGAWVRRLARLNAERLSGDAMPSSAWVQQLRDGIRRGRRAWVNVPDEGAGLFPVGLLDTGRLLTAASLLTVLSGLVATTLKPEIAPTSPLIAAIVVATSATLVVLTTWLWRRMVLRFSVRAARALRDSTALKFATRRAVQRSAERLAAAVLEREASNIAETMAVAGLDTKAANVTFHKPGSANGGPAGSLTSAAQFLDGLPSRRLVIVGGAGSGKTVLATQLVRDYAARITRDGQEAVVMPVPVRLNLANWYDVKPTRKGRSTRVATTDLVAFIVRQLRREYAVPLGEAVRLVATGRVLPVLDGLDEMDRLDVDQDGTTSYPRATAAVVKINDYLRKRDSAPLVVICRDPMYERLERHVTDATVIRIDPLDAGEIDAYIEGKLAPHLVLWRRWAPVVADLKANPYGSAHAALRTPWVLTLALAATGMRGGFDPTSLLRPDVSPEEVKRELIASFAAAVYERAHERSLVDHDYPMFGVASAHTLQQWLRRLARYLDEFGGMRLTSQESISTIEITLHTMWPIAGRYRTRAIHLVGHTLLVTAVLIPCYLAVLGGIGNGPATFMKLVQEGAEVDSVTARRLGWLVGASVVVYAWAGWLALTADPHRSRTESYSFRSTAMRSMPVPWRIVAGAELALAMGAGFGVPAILFAGLTVGTIVGATIGIFFGIVMARIGLDRGLTGGYDKGIGWRNELGLGLVLAGVGALGFPLLVGYPWWAGAALLGAMGFAGAYALSMQAWLRYVIAMSTMKSRGELPWRLGAFLFWAHGAGLFRISGVGYQYRHGELQEWFARSGSRTGHRQTAPDDPSAEAPSPVLG